MFNGCEFHCKNCFNSNTWNFNGGENFTEDTLNKLLDLCESNTINGLSILGGEPMHPNNAETVLKIVQEFKKRYPNKTIWIWSGFLFENLIERETTLKILKNIDILVDGLFVDELKNLTLKWRGSANQRVIDVKESLKNNRAVIAKDLL